MLTTDNCLSFVLNRSTVSLKSPCVRGHKRRQSKAARRARLLS